MQVAGHSIQYLGKNLSLLIITSYAMDIIENFYELILFYWDEAATICKILSLFLNESYWHVNNYSSEPILSFMSFVIRQDYIHCPKKRQ